MFGRSVSQQRMDPISCFNFMMRVYPPIGNNVDSDSTTPLKLVSLTHTSKVSQVVLNDVTSVASPTNLELAFCKMLSIGIQSFFLLGM